MNNVTRGWCLISVPVVGAGLAARALFAAAPKQEESEEGQARGSRRHAGSATPAAAVHSQVTLAPSVALAGARSGRRSS